MKKLLLFGIGIIFITNSFAQTLTAIQGDKVKPPVNHSITKANDTIWTYLNRGTNFYIYSTGDGYIFGNNSYYTKTAMQYDAIANASVIEIMLWVGACNVIGAADSLILNVYDDATGPGAVLGTAKIGTDVIVVSNYNYLALTTPVNTNGNMFYVGIDAAFADDTIGVVCNDPSTNDGQGEKRAYLYMGTWKTVDATFGGFDADGMYIPVVDITTGADFMEQNGLKIMRTYPNPTKDVANIHYSIDNAQNVKIKVFDITEKTIYKTESYQTIGEHIVPVDFSDMSSGNYYYSITTNNAKITSKISVIK